MLTNEANLARAVLNDCRASLRELRANPVGQEWRLRWVATLALLRTISYALRKDSEDASIDPRLRKRLAEHWLILKSTRPEPQIYWDFIREGANAALHEYSFQAIQILTIRDDAHGTVETYASSAIGTVPFAVSSSARRKWAKYPMRGGPYHGYDQRLIVRAAIMWWAKQIRNMEEAATRDTEYPT